MQWSFQWGKVTEGFQSLGTEIKRLTLDLPHSGSRPITRAGNGEGNTLEIHAESHVRHADIDRSR
jgi:hypothetical protein